MMLPVAGCGFVNVFDTSGNFLRRLILNGELNAPWGLALVEGGLWVGNFGDGLHQQLRSGDRRFYRDADARRWHAASI